MRDDTVIIVMRAFKDALLQRESAQMAQMARAYLALQESLQADIELLARQITEAKAKGQVVSQAKVMRLERWQVLAQQLQNRYALFAEFAANTISAEQLEWGQLGIQHATQAINTHGAGVVAGFDILPADAITHMVGLLGDGTPLQQLLADRAVSASMLDGIMRQLLEGVARGYQPRKTAQRMRDELAGGLQKALTIARTEQMRVYRAANRQQMQASGVVAGYYRVATRDDRVCPACLALDGQFYELDEDMPEHPQGRCSQVPAVAGAAPPQWLRGPDWLAQQDDATQRSILGAQRHELWRSGQISLQDMVQLRDDGVWGTSTQVVPAKQLMAA